MRIGGRRRRARRRRRAWKIVDRDERRHHGRRRRGGRRAARHERRRARERSGRDLGSRPLSRHGERARPAERLTDGRHRSLGAPVRRRPRRRDHERRRDRDEPRRYGALSSRPRRRAEEHTRTKRRAVARRRIPFFRAKREDGALERVAGAHRSSSFAKSSRIFRRACHTRARTVVSDAPTIAATSTDVRSSTSHRTNATR
jgi:hypothetical protein